ncbi:acyltransferase domain-containing protein [Microlunatus speluncae]|uniref:acyltransferase domain-containing protein n=1 Tax=Microlunatus speluncae TaxID=2594267 RepID=UPI0012663051|nr:acyltransferase domain-containing protein [Microlunatus speluncae]
METPDWVTASLDWLGVPAVEAAELADSFPDDPGIRREIVAAGEAIAASIGIDRTRPKLIEPPAEWGAAGRYFVAYACLSVIEEVRRDHRDHGVPDAISAHSLNALSLNLERHRRIYGIGGLDGPAWVIDVWRGLIFRLGRLDYKREPVGPVAGAASRRPAEQPGLSVHIPIGGRLDPGECDASLARTAAFFRRHFPAEYAGLDLIIGHCRSWLIDPQLADHLPVTSNIVDFGRRFMITADATPGDREIVRWVFEAADPTDLAALTPTSRLERAVLDHLTAGHHWNIAFGWLHL